jgi:hypothetical protein
MIINFAEQIYIVKLIVTESLYFPRFTETDNSIPGWTPTKLFHFMVSQVASLRSS